MSMFLKWAFDRFSEKSPVTVMTRALMEHAFDTKALDALFGEHAERQWEKKLLFSSLVDLMSLVVCRVGGDLILTRTTVGICDVSAG